MQHRIDQGSFLALSDFFCVLCVSVFPDLRNYVGDYEVIVTGRNDDKMIEMRPKDCFFFLLTKNCYPRSPPNSNNKIHFSKITPTTATSQQPLPNASRIAEEAR